ncbi:MAG: hypothetical protein WCD70_17220 [Alphaproteobacteria bacterium]
MKTFCVLSLGAGVQSTTMALMAAVGEIADKPDVAIFADTGWEPKAVYAHLEWLERTLPFPVRRVASGNLHDDIINPSGRFSPVPWFIRNADGSAGMGRRQCTRQYKLEPIAKEIRRLLGYEPYRRIPVGSAEIWIGISTDEASRMKPARTRWQTNRWPLIEARLSRQDCLAWLSRNGFPQPPKSSCIGCPFHSDAMWRDMKNFNPTEWEEAVAFDRRIRNQGAGFSEQFMHRSLKPLDEVEFLTSPQPNLFINECEGMCGV